jgi:hypothetical protein
VLTCPAHGSALTGEGDAPGEDSGEKRRKIDRKLSGILITFANTPAKPQPHRADDGAAGDSPSRWLHITNLRRPFTLGMLRTTVEQVRTCALSRAYSVFLDRLCKRSALVMLTALRSCLHRRAACTIVDNNAHVFAPVCCPYLV